MKLITCLLVTLTLTACSHPTEWTLNPQKSPDSLRVLSYNIHHGEGMDGEIDLARIADVIMTTNADLVALQEVDKGVKRTNQVDQPAVLAQLTGMHVVFEKNIYFQGGEYGNAVLSRRPVEHFKNHALPQSVPGEQRGLLEIHIKIAGRAIVFFATHLDYHEDDGERLASVDMIRNLIDHQQGKAVIVAGDLNVLPESRVMKKVQAFLIDTHIPDATSELVAGIDPGFTYPADKPDRRIDYILHTLRSGLRPIESRVIDEPVASDHRPLLAVFELPAQ